MSSCWIGSRTLPSHKIHFFLGMQQSSRALEQFFMCFRIFRTLANLFRRNGIGTRQTSSVDVKTWSSPRCAVVDIYQCSTPIDFTHSCRICDLTGQLFNIPRHTTASGGYSDVWKCDWIKDGTIVKVIRQFRCKS